MSNMLIHCLFEEQAKQKPSNIAMIDGKLILTYQQLNVKADKLAILLKKLGVKKNIPVGISSKSSFLTIIGIMAILKADGVYVPINPELPPQTSQFILSDTQMPLLLTTEKLIDDYEKFNMSLFDDWSVILFSEKKTYQPISHPSHLAYIIYTSGTTGTPKGVLVSHENLVKTYQGWEEIYQLKSRLMNHLQMANFTFDVFTGDWVRALCSSGKLILCTQEDLLNIDQLYSLMLQHQINCAEFVPSVLRKLIQYLEITRQNMNFMEVLICGSDSWTIGEYKKFKEYCAPNTRLINSYGLTEATIDSTFFECTNINDLMLDDQQLVPLGQPFPDVEIYILDESLKPVKKGQVGEIYIGGPGVSCGYLNKPQLTAEKFVKNPFAESSGQNKLLKTGDLGKLLKDGNIAFSGRKDTQAKIHGHRIELSAIEAALNEHSGIQESIVAVIKKRYNNDEHISAWLVLKVEYPLTNKELQSFLKEKLPSYMIPTEYYQIDYIPLTTNGKINRKNLPAFNKMPSIFFS